MRSPLAFVVRVLVIAAALWVATKIVPGIGLGAGTQQMRAGTLLAVALIFGVVNAVLKPVIKVLGCPLYILSLGLFALVVNALLFQLVGWIAGQAGLPFVVQDFYPAAFFGAIVVAVVAFVLHVLIPDSIDER